MKVSNISLYESYKNCTVDKNLAKINNDQNKEIQSNIREIGSDQLNRQSLWYDKMSVNIKDQYAVSEDFSKDSQLDFNKKMLCWKEYNSAHAEINSYRSKIYDDLHQSTSSILALKYYRNSTFEKYGNGTEDNRIADLIEKNSQITEDNEKNFIEIDKAITAYRNRINVIKNTPNINSNQSPIDIYKNPNDNLRIILDRSSTSSKSFNSINRSLEQPKINAVANNILVKIDTNIGKQSLKTENKTKVVTNATTDKVVSKYNDQVNGSTISSVNFTDSKRIGENIKVELLKNRSSFDWNSCVNRDNLKQSDKELYDLISRIGKELSVDQEDFNNLQVKKDCVFNIAKVTYQNIIDTGILDKSKLKTMDRVDFSIDNKSGNGAWDNWVKQNIHNLDENLSKDDLAKYLRFINTSYLNGQMGVQDNSSIHENVGALINGSSITDRTVGLSLLKLKEKYGLIDSKVAFDILKSLIINQIKQQTPGITNEQIIVNASMLKYRTNELYAAYRGINQSKLNLDYIDKVEGRVDTKEAVSYVLKSFVDINEIITIRKSCNLDVSPENLFENQKDNLCDLIKRLGHVQRAGNRNNRDAALDVDDLQPDRGVCAHGTFNQIIEIGNFKHNDINVLTDAKTLFDNRWSTVAKEYWSILNEQQRLQLQDAFDKNTEIRLSKKNDEYTISNLGKHSNKLYTDFVTRITEIMDSEFNFFNQQAPNYLGVKISTLEANINNLQYIDFGSDV